MTHEEKEQFLKNLAHNYNVCIETGTHRGVMALAVSQYFEDFYTIEIDHNLYDEFNNRDIPSNVHAYHGDSRLVLSSIISILEDNSKVVFFLDAHGKFGDTISPCPLLDEIEIIKASNINDYVIVIDDYNLLGKHDFPTLKEIQKQLGKGTVYENLLIYEKSN